MLLRRDVEVAHDDYAIGALLLDLGGADDQNLAVGLDHDLAAVIIAAEKIALLVSDDLTGGREQNNSDVVVAVSSVQLSTADDRAVRSYH